VAATIFFAVGGALGAQSWRTPCWLYAASLPLAAPAARYVWQPVPGGRQSARKLPALPWRQLAAPVGVSLLGGSIFYVLIIELSVKLDHIGVQSAATIGAVSAVASLGTAAGGFLFGRIARLGTAITVPLAFALSGLGLLGLALAPTVPLVVVCAVLTGFGNGLLLPAMLTWAPRSLTFEQRGRGTGVWTSTVFLGQFACPLLVLALTGAIGGLNAALLALGALAFLTCARQPLSLTGAAVVFSLETTSGPYRGLSRANGPFSGPNGSHSQAGSRGPSTSAPCRRRRHTTSGPTRGRW
jgi:MFS family permease